MDDLGRERFRFAVAVVSRRIVENQQAFPSDLFLLQWPKVVTGEIISVFVDPNRARGRKNASLDHLLVARNIGRKGDLGVAETDSRVFEMISETELVDLKFSESQPRRALKKGVFVVGDDSSLSFYSLGGRSGELKERRTEPGRNGNREVVGRNLFQSRYFQKVDLPNQAVFGCQIGKVVSDAEVESIPFSDDLRAEVEGYSRFTVFFLDLRRERSGRIPSDDVGQTFAPDGELVLGNEVLTGEILNGNLLGYLGVSVLRHGVGCFVTRLEFSRGVGRALRNKQ